MRFHEVFLGSQHEIWSKQHNGKVSSLLLDTIKTRSRVAAIAVHLHF